MQKDHFAYCLDSVFPSCLPNNLDCTHCPDQESCQIWHKGLVSSSPHTLLDWENPAPFICTKPTSRIPLHPNLPFIAVIKHRTEQLGAGKGWPAYTSKWHSLIVGSWGRSSSRNLEAVVTAETMEKRCSLASPRLMFSCHSYTVQSNLPRMALSQSGLGPPLSTSKQENAPQTWPRANLMEAVLRPRFLSSRVSLVWTKLAKN